MVNDCPPAPARVVLGGRDVLLMCPARHVVARIPAPAWPGSPAEADYSRATPVRCTGTNPTGAR